MGGYYDDHQSSWYFPLNLQDCGNGTFYEFNPTSANLPLASPSVSVIAAPPRRRYGFFMLRLMDMTWSILPASFPKKILTERSNSVGNSSNYYNSMNKNKQIPNKFSATTTATTTNIEAASANRKSSSDQINTTAMTRTRRLHSF